MVSGLFCECSVKESFGKDDLGMVEVPSRGQNDLLQLALWTATRATPPLYAAHRL